MQAVFVLAALLLVEVHSQVCNSTTFWNPLNNACVNRKNADTQSAPRSLPSSTTPIRAVSPILFLRILAKELKNALHTR